jgi:hypothetical protein
MFIRPISLPLFCGLIFEPEVFETRAVVDAVDMGLQPRSD